MTTSTDSLTRAIEYLGAVDLGDGRYAFKDGVSGRYRVVASMQVERFARYFLPNESAAVGAVLQGDSALMPTWWTPTQQYAVRHGGDRIVTANLETGEEIPGRRTVRNP